MRWKKGATHRASPNMDRACIYLRNPISASGAEFRTVRSTPPRTRAGPMSSSYMDTAHSFYLRVYDQNGGTIASYERTLTTRQGGDGYTTAGQNLGALLGRINLRGHLLNTAMDQISGNSHVKHKSPKTWKEDERGFCSNFPSAKFTTEDGRELPCSNLQSQ